MTFIRGVFIFATILVFFYTIYLLIQRKQLFINIQKQNTPTIEGMTSTDIQNSIIKDTKKSTSIVKSLAIQTPPHIQSVVLYAKYPLHQLCIKGSYNSAYTGAGTFSYGYISDEMLKYVLCRGCRYIDFETFYLTDINTGQTDAFVGYSKYKNDEPSIKNKINVKLQDLLSVAIQYGMMNSFAGRNIGINYSVKNINDPLFIQIRINGYTPRNNKIPLLNAIQSAVDSLKTIPSFGSVFPPDGTPPVLTRNTEINKPVYLNSIMGKVVFVVENDPDVSNINSAFYDNFLSQYNVLFLNEGYINRQTKYSQINPNKNKSNPPGIIKSPDLDGINQPMTNVQFIQTVTPDKNGDTNVDIYSSILNYGNQINLIQYFVSDTSNSQNLTQTEKLFDLLGFAFVPLSTAMDFVNQNQDQN